MKLETRRSEWWYMLCGRLEQSRLAAAITANEGSRTGRSPVEGWLNAAIRTNHRNPYCWAMCAGVHAQTRTSFASTTSSTTGSRGESGKRSYGGEGRDKVEELLEQARRCHLNHGGVWRNLVSRKVAHEGGFDEGGGRKERGQQGGAGGVENEVVRF